MEDTYFDIYFYQFCTTLGQVSALLVATTVAVPVFQFYYQKIVQTTQTIEVTTNHTTKNTNHTTENTEIIQSSECEESDFDE
jgi:hypothetical protein